MENITGKIKYLFGNYEGKGEPAYLILALFYGLGLILLKFYNPICKRQHALPFFTVTFPAVKEIIRA